MNTMLRTADASDCCNVLSCNVDYNGACGGKKINETVSAKKMSPDQMVKAFMLLTWKEKEVLSTANHLFLEVLHKIGK